jgi:uncharacterized protein
MLYHGEKEVISSFDFTIPLNDDGSVIYFAINGKRFLLNGNTGFFSDSLPELTSGMVEALQKSDENFSKARTGLTLKYGIQILRMLEEIKSITNRTGNNKSEYSKQNTFLQRMSPNVFNVYVAQKCNLSCSYCYNQGGTFGQLPSLMSKKTAGDVLSFISTVVESEKYPLVTVNLYGGEPLMAPESTFLLSLGLQNLNNLERKTQVRTNLSTNGTIDNKKIFEVYSRHPKTSQVIISLDAPKESHDKNRPFANRDQKSSYQSVLSNFDRIKKALIPYSVTCVVPYPFDFVGAAEELSSLGVQRLKLKPLIHHIFGSSSLPDVFENDFVMWRRNQIAYSDYHIEHLKTPSPIEHVSCLSLMNKYALALSKNGKLRSALACGTGDFVAAISSDGKIFPCEGFLGHPEFELGDVRTGFCEKKYAEFESWLHRNGQHRYDHVRCRSCYAKLICGGGCYAISYDKTGRLNPADESACRFIREKVKIDLYYLSRLKENHPGLYS